MQHVRGGEPAVIVLGWRELARLGVPELLQLRREGKLDRRRVWVLMRGAGTYLPAMAVGRVRDEQAADALARTCSTCPLHTTREVVLEGEQAVGLYCGEIGVPDQANGTCGCLVGITVEGGAVHAAGKSCVAGMRCGAGRWERSVRVTPRGPGGCQDPTPPG